MSQRIFSAWMCLTVQWACTQTHTCARTHMVRGSIWSGSVHPGFHGCLKSLHGGMLTRRGPSSRLHQWHGWMWGSYLGGGSHSANQGKQATLYLMIIPASVPYLSSLCESRQRRAQMHSQELRQSHPGERLHSGFHRLISSQFNHTVCILNRLRACDSLYS